MTEIPGTSSFRLDGRLALVAGASSGIGLGASVALADAGARVLMASRNMDRLESAASALRERDYSVDTLRLDVTDVETAAATIAARGPFDILVNSAGTSRHAAAVDVTPKDFDAVANLNLRGAFFLTQAVAKGLIEAGKPGSLINLSSQMGQVGGIERAAYCASKHAVEGFSKAMALEFAPHQIRVNTICPTFIRTPLIEATLRDPDQVRRVQEKIKLGRIGEVEDVMGAVVYLASDASSLVTGTSLIVDGGWTAD